MVNIYGKYMENISYRKYGFTVSNQLRQDLIEDNNDQT